jgi:hypothetical protein
MKSNGFAPLDASADDATHGTCPSEPGLCSRTEIDVRRVERDLDALVFVSKNVRGYEIMKDIMAGESSTQDEGVPSFTYSPADARCPLLFSLSQPISALADDLLKKFAGRTLTMQAVYETHHVNTPYISRNYKRALSELEAADQIAADPPAAKRRMRGGERTFGDTVRVTFPKRKDQ